MNLETVLLGFLNEDSMTGYDLSKKMDVSVGFFWHANHPQIYTCLKKLVSQGHITFDHKVPEFGPVKKIYFVTKTGKENLLQSIKDDIETSEIKFPLLVSMFHGSELGKEHWITVLESQLIEQQSMLQVYEAICKNLPQIHSSQDINTYLKLRTIEFGIGYQNHFIDWLKETLVELKK